MGSKSLDSRITKSDKPAETAPVILVGGGALPVGGTCELSGLADVNGDGGESWMKSWKIPAKSKRELQIRETDGQIDRRVIARQLWGHHCRVVGLIKG